MLEAWLVRERYGPLHVRYGRSHFCVCSWSTVVVVSTLSSAMPLGVYGLKVTRFDPSKHEAFRLERGHSMKVRVGVYGVHLDALRLEQDLLPIKDRRGVFVDPIRLLDSLRAGGSILSNAIAPEGR
jgi:hypothetical protein